MSNNTNGPSNGGRPILRQLRRSKTINVSQLVSNEDKHGHEVSFDDETAGARSQSPGPQPTSSCQALRHAVSALTRIDDFILEELGDGFFANVYKATHKVTGEEMVMKINKDSANRPSALREVQLMNRLSHPNILRFLGVCVHEGQLHALTEYVSGGTLWGMLSSKEEELPWTLRIKLSLDIAKGVHYLHSEGVFHRDLTSKNILIKKKENKNYTAIVADFGLATKIPDPNSTEPLPSVGCPWWMAPEVIHGKFYDQRADIFSFGIILLEITTRIDADPESMPRTQKFGVDYVKLCDIVDYCPLDFLQFAFKCCQILPERRPSTASVMETLEKIYKNLRNDSLTAMGRLYKRSRSEDNIIQSSEAASDDEVFVTAQIVAQAMRKDDPLYCPTSANPFASLGRLKDGHKVLEIPRGRRHSSVGSGSGVGAFFRRGTSDSTCDSDCGRQWESQSLPSSPVMLRRAAEKLHQASLHGTHAVELTGDGVSSSFSRHDLRGSLSSEGYESGSFSCWDGDKSGDLDGEGPEAEARRARFGCNRTRSLGSLDFWTPPPHRPRARGAGLAQLGSGFDPHRTRQLLVQQDPSDRAGFCNRVTSGIRESSLENILEPSTASSDSPDGVGHLTSSDTGAEEYSYPINGDGEEEDPHSANDYFSVAENLSALQGKHQLNPSPSGQEDRNASNSVISGFSTSLRDGEEEKMVVGDGEEEAGMETSDGRSVSSSSLSSYLSCSETGEEATDRDGDLSSLVFSLSSPHRPLTQPPPPAPPRPQIQSSRLPLIEHTLMMNGDVPEKLSVAMACSSRGDEAGPAPMGVPLIAQESGSFAHDHFGKVKASNGIATTTTTTTPSTHK